MYQPGHASRARNRRLIGRAVTILAVAVIAALQSWRGCSLEERQPEPVPEGHYHVRRVVDGDTLLMQDHKRLRLMGVDTPETVKEDTPVQPWGPEATQFTREFVGDGNSDVRLQFDRERTDRFGRYLAYVWVGDRMLNEELLRAGLARWEPGYHYSQSMKNRFRRAQAQSAAGEARDLERTGRRTSPVAEFRKRALNEQCAAAGIQSPSAIDTSATTTPPTNWSTAMYLIPLE